MKRRRLNKKHLVEFVLYVACLFVFIWIFASFIDTNLHNQPFTAHYGEFAEWNIFIKFFKELSNYGSVR